MKRFKITLEYDGTRYVGWQVQPNGPTIQQTLEEKLEVLFRGRVKIESSGRTDAGVHALGHVAAFSVETDSDCDRIARSLNGLLPLDIRVVGCDTVPLIFDPRRDALSKTYIYRWLNRQASSPFQDRFTWHVRQALDVESMEKAAACLLGEHDFTSFRASDCVAKTAVRRILALDFSWQGPVLQMQITGTAFLKQMVRNIAGTLYEVGLKKRGIEEISEILRAKDRTRAGRTAPARGLCMTCVEYGAIPRPGRLEKH